MTIDTTYEAQDLEYLVIRCSKCDTETSFFLRANYRAQKITCPGCDAEIMSIQRQEGGFEFNLITLYQMFFNAKGADRVKFRVSKPAH